MANKTKLICILIQTSKVKLLKKYALFMYLIFLTGCDEGFNTKISKKRIDELEVGNEKMVGLSYINKEKELIINNHQYFLGQCAEPPFLDIYALKDTLSKYNLTLEKVKVISETSNRTCIYSSKFYTISHQFFQWRL